MMENYLYDLSLAFFGLNFIFSLLKREYKFMLLLQVLAPCTLFLGLICRGLVYTRFPMASLYEFSLVLVGLFGFGLVVLRQFYQGEKWIFRLGDLLATVTLGFVLGYLAGNPVSLLPALQSPWFFSHILSALVAYLAFALAFILALVFLLKKEEVVYRLMINLIYFGLVGQTLLLVTGSLWALETWGRFWAWDPKEVWALLTYLAYATVLHFHFTAYLSKRSLAKMVAVSFVILVFTLFGVSLGLTGLHSY